MGMCTCKFVRRIDFILSVLTAIKQTERGNVLKEILISKNFAIQKVLMNIFTNLTHNFIKDLY